MAKKSSVKVKVQGDFGESRFARNFDRAQRIIDTQVLKDTTPYVPRDTGNLALIQGDILPEGGTVIWYGPYAARQYYSLPNKAHDVHPLATMRWFDYSKAANKDAWLRVTKKAGGAQ